MKDIFDAIDSRIKSPVFGYFLLSMFAFNWQPIFFLLFDDGSVIDRIAYFDEHTNAETLLVLPLIFTALYPWLQYAFIWINSKPHELKRSLHNTAEHTDIMKKQKLARERKEYEETLVSNVIERAKTDQKVAEEFEDEDTREKVQSEIESIRKENNSNADEDEIAILKIITERGGRSLQKTIIEDSLFGKVKTEYLLETLQDKGFLHLKYLRHFSDNEISLTTYAKKLMIDKGVV